MAATFPTTVKNFGADHINGEIVTPGDVNDLRAEVAAVQSLNAYRISPSIVSNNLKLEIKALSGGDPSTTEPISFMIASLGHTLTAALSVTINAGTSIFNAGSTETKANDMDLFVYIGWRAASSTLFVLVSRIPWARTYADFSATSTNEKYGAYSGLAPAPTDAVRVIGRFAAQNSGSGSFNWSIPGPFVVHEPIFETRILTCVSVTTGFSADYTRVVKYQIVGRQMWYSHIVSSGSTSNTTGYTATLPFSASVAYFYSVLCADNSALINSNASVAVGSNILTFYKGASATAASWTAAGNKYCYFTGSIPIG